LPTLMFRMVDSFLVSCRIAPTIMAEENIFTEYLIALHLKVLVK
jgi:hypothetical protein